MVNADISALVQQYRHPDYPIHPLLYSRWSPRAMSGESLSDAELLPLFEAARWAPSSGNKQPWLFLYAKRDTEYWSLYYNLLDEFNQLWTKNAAVLVVVTAQVQFGEKLSRTAVYSSGSAWQNLALEATHRGLIAHGMSGFDFDKAKEMLRVPDTHQVAAMIAIGKPGPKSTIPERMWKQEVPNQRKPVTEIIKEGTF